MNTTSPREVKVGILGPSSASTTQDVDSPSIHNIVGPFPSSTNHNSTVSLPGLTPTQSFTLPLPDKRNLSSKPVSTKNPSLPGNLDLGESKKGPLLHPSTSASNSSPIHLSLSAKFKKPFMKNDSPVILSEAPESLKTSFSSSSDRVSFVFFPSRPLKLSQEKELEVVRLVRMEFPIN